MARITVAKLFETVAEVDQRSQVALMQSEDSIKISEKNRIDLEKLIATLRTDFTDIEQTQEIIRSDKEEDNTIRSSFSELKKSFDGLVGTVDILRTDLDNLYEAFYTSQIKRQDLLNQEEAKVFKEEDDLQKGRGLEKEGKGVLSNMLKDKKDPNQLAQQRKKEEKSLIQGILSTLGLGALAGGAMGLSEAFDLDDRGEGPVQTGSINAAEIDVDDPLSQALIATVRELEGTADPTGYSTFFGDKPGEPKYGDLREKTIQEVHDLQTLFLKDPQSEFTDLAGKVQNSAAVGAGQFIDPLGQTRQMYEARGEQFDPTKIKFSEELQNQLILDLAARKRGIDLSKELTKAEFDILQNEWSAFGPNNNQTTRTLDQTLRVYQENLREARNPIATPSSVLNQQLPDPNKRADQNVDAAGRPIPTGTFVGGDDMQPRRQVTPPPPTLPPSPPENDLSGQGEPDLIFKPGTYGPSSYTPVKEDKQIASLKLDRSPNISIMNLGGEVIDGGTQDQRPRGKAASQSTALSNTKNQVPILAMIENGYLGA